MAAAAAASVWKNGMKVMLVSTAAASPGLPTRLNMSCYPRQELSIVLTVRTLERVSEARYSDTANVLAC